MKKGLSSRYNKSFDSKENGGGGKSAFKWPQGTEFFKAKEGKNRINIIPYEIKSNNHPLVKSGDMEIGDIDYVMDIYIHRSVGLNKTDIVCLKKNFGKHCPVCEQAEKYRDNGQEEEWKQLKPSRKCIYNVTTAADPEKLMVFDVSHFLFEKELITEAKEADDNGEMIDFADPKHGKIIAFRGETAKLGKNEYLEYKSFQFLNREDSVAGLVNDAISFDEIMNILTPAEIEKILEGDEGEEGIKKEKRQDDEQLDRPKRKRDEEEEDEPAPRKKERRTDDDDEPAPRSKKHTEEEEDDDPMVQPGKRSNAEESNGKKSEPSGTGSLSKCPAGHKFGVDCDEFDECEKCELWKECYKKSQ